MRWNRLLAWAMVAGVICGVALRTARATQTENLGIRVLPAGAVTVDGKADDWDLSGGVFACDDVENQRGTIRGLGPRDVRRGQPVRAGALHRPDAAE